MMKQPGISFSSCRFLLLDLACMASFGKIYSAVCSWFLFWCSVLPVFFFCIGKIPKFIVHVTHSPKILFGRVVVACFVLVMSTIYIPFHFIRQWQKTKGSITKQYQIYFPLTLYCKYQLKHLTRKNKHNEKCTHIIRLVAKWFPSGPKITYLTCFF